MTDCSCTCGGQPTPYSILTDPEDGEDVFESIFPDTVMYHNEKRAQLWSRFHDTGIGNSDKEYWKRCMKFRAAEIEQRYVLKFKAWLEFRTAAASGIDLSSGRTESDSTVKTYDPPETSVQQQNAEQYLAEQGRTDFNQKTYSGLGSETVRDWMDGVENPYEEYAREYDRLFYWGL